MTPSDILLRATALSLPVRSRPAARRRERARAVLRALLLVPLEVTRRGGLRPAEAAIYLYQGRALPPCTPEALFEAHEIVRLAA